MLLIKIIIDMYLISLSTYNLHVGHTHQHVYEYMLLIKIIIDMYLISLSTYNLHVGHTN